MRVISVRALREFWESHKRGAAAEQPLKAWYAEAKTAQWLSPSDVKAVYGHNVSILKDGRAVFDIKGNDYRLVVRINYAFGIVFVRFIGTHAEYDQIDAQTI